MTTASEVNLNQTAPQTAFNDLRLPVLWLDDRIDPGELGPDEIYTHPSFEAVNAFLKRMGIQEIAPQAIVRAGLRYVNTEPNKRPSHPLLEKDLRSRGEPFSVFDVNSIPDGPYRKAARELVKVVALSDLYARLQLEPRYAIQLRKVVESKDAARIHHYWLKGRMGCIDADLAGEQKDPLACNAVPGGTRELNGVWYPRGWTQADIDHLQKEYKWPSEILKRKVFSPEVRIVPAKKGNPDAFLYKGSYYKPTSMRSLPDLALLSDMMAEHLKRAAALLKPIDPQFAEMLEGRARYLKSDSLFADLPDDQHWARTVNPVISFSLSRGEKYKVFGSPFGLNNVMMGFLGYNDPSLQTFLQGVITLHPEAQAELARLWTDAGEKPPYDTGPRPVPTVEVVNTILSGGIANSADYVAGGFNQPNTDRYEKEILEREAAKRLTLLTQILNLRVRNQGLPLAEVAFDPDFVATARRSLTSPYAGIAFVFGHEVDHSLGVDHNVAVPIVGSKKKQTLKEAYGEQRATGLEEGKADLQGLFHFPLYVRHQRISPEDKHLAYYYYLTQGLRDLTLGAEDEHGLGFIYEWHLLTKYEVITYAEGKHHFDPKRFEERLSAMVKEYSDAYGSGDPKRVEAFEREALAKIAADTPIGKAIAEVKQRKGGTKMDRPYYVVLGL